jgi:hypothetical protein
MWGWVGDGKKACASVIEFEKLHWSADVVGICYFLHVFAFRAEGTDIEIGLDGFSLFVCLYIESSCASSSVEVVDYAGVKSKN